MIAEFSIECPHCQASIDLDACENEDGTTNLSTYFCDNCGAELDIEYAAHKYQEYCEENEELIREKMRDLSRDLKKEMSYE